jgi:hypothetical protein
VALGWQVLTTRSNYHGNWTGLFHTGSHWPVPRELAFERVYVFRDNSGYDGQFYHYVAHDPLLQRGLQHSVDNPRLRWRAILVPGAAFLLASGQQHLIDAAYRLAILASVFLGSYWLSRYGCHHRMGATVGLLFLFVPATITSVDRMTVDVALAALCAGYAYYAAREQVGRLWAILALAPLARDTGLGLLAGYGLYSLARRRWLRALGSAAATVPYLGWSWYLHRHTPPDPGMENWLSWVPLQGLLTRTLQPLPSSLANRWLVTAAVLDYCAVLAIWLALFLAVPLLWRRSFGPLETAIAPFLVLAVFVDRPELWAGGYELGRLMSPFLLLLALAGIGARFGWSLLPLCLVAPRLLFQLQPQLLRVLSGLLRWPTGPG